MSEKTAVNPEALKALSAKFAVISEDFSNGNERDVDLPTGFTQSNSVIVSINLLSGNYLYSEASLATDADIRVTARLTTTNKVKIIPSGTYARGTVKVTIMRI